MNRSAFIKKQLKEITNRISRYYKPDKVILFGSALTGRLKKGSDLDLLIIKNTKTNPWDRITEADRRIEHNIPLDILIYTPDEIKERLDLNDFFIEDIIKNGKVLYEKGHKKNNRRMDGKSRKRPSIR